MKTMSSANLKANFSTVVDDLKRGEEIVITYGRKKEPIGTIIPQSQLQKPDYSVNLGDLKQDGWTYDMVSFELSDEDMIGADVST